MLAAYDAQYSAGTNETEWRELGGRYKAENILALCAGRSFPKVLDCGAGEGAVLKYRILYGKRRFQEFGCSAYACLAKGDGDLTLM